MPLETACLKQDAVLWVSAGKDNDGEPTVSAATAIKIRWEDGQGEIQNGQGAVVAYDATAYVSSALAFESVLYLGTVDAFTDDTDPELYRVVGRTAIPDVKGNNFRRSVALARSGGTLPAIV